MSHQYGKQTFYKSNPPIEIEWSTRHPSWCASTNQTTDMAYSVPSTLTANYTTVHASKDPLVRNMMNTVKYIAFNYSTQSLRVFQTELELDEDAQAGMNNRSNLPSLCLTIWCSRANALYTFRSTLAVVVSALGYFEEEDGDGKVRRFLLSIKNA